MLYICQLEGESSHRLLAVLLDALTPCQIPNLVFRILQSVGNLCYLPIGVGMFLSSAVHGRILDAEYRRMRQRWLVGRGPDEGEKGPTGFPIERARLRLIPLHILVFAGCVIGWGWSLEAGVHLAAPLCLSLPSTLTFGLLPCFCTC